MASSTLVRAERTFEVRSPRDGTLVATFPLDGPSEVAAAVSAARRAGTGWASRSPFRRVEALVRLAHAFEEQSDELANAIVA